MPQASQVQQTSVLRFHHLLKRDSEATPKILMPGGKKKSVLFRVAFFLFTGMLENFLIWSSYRSHDIVTTSIAVSQNEWVRGLE